MLIIAVHPSPYLWKERVYFNYEFDKKDTDSYYHVNEILILVLLCRIYIVVRGVLMLTNWSSNRT